jgi:hypothetical protein
VDLSVENDEAGVAWSSGSVMTHIISWISTPDVMLRGRRRAQPTSGVAAVAGRSTSTVADRGTSTAK